MSTQPSSFQLNADDGTPIAKLGAVDGTLGNRAVDVRRLLGDAGLFAYDPSFGSTAACESAITFIDGDEGILLHRGYSIDALTEKATYLEMCYLLLFGELPCQSELDTFVHDITYHTMVHEQVIRFYAGFPAKAHPMSVMLGVVGALSAFYPDSTDVFDPDERMISIYRLLAKMPTIAAMAYKNMVGQPFVSPLNRLNYSDNFLNMMFSVPAEPYVIKPVMSKALNALLVTQADHEQNASTATVRTVGSSRANPFACIAGGIASLWGPLHGGANEEVLGMLMSIGTKDRIPQFIARAKDKNDPYRLMGFGHRVYKNYDPRATVMQKICDDVFNEVGSSDPLLELARELERAVLADDYFHQRKLFPNVDFYSGIVMRALGLPMEMFTPMFAVARTAGWLAQWKEMIEDPDGRITRPRQIYTGVQAREFVPIAARKGAIGAAMPKREPQVVAS